MATKKNDPVKPKKDKWGRSEGSKYYSFNPSTKNYEDDKKKQKALDYKRAAAESPVRAAIDKKLRVNTLMTDPTPGFKKGGAINAKVVASKVAKGIVGGKSKAPKTALPKAKMGMNMKRKSY